MEYSNNHVEVSNYCGIPPVQRNRPTTIGLYKRTHLDDSTWKTVRRHGVIDYAFYGNSLCHFLLFLLHEKHSKRRRRIDERNMLKGLVFLDEDKKGSLVETASGMTVALRSHGETAGCLMKRPHSPHVQEFLNFKI
jgi:hypothetical protein